MYKKLSSRIRAMLLMACACLGCRTAANHRPACPAIEMTVVEDSPSEPARVVAMNDGTNIRLARTPLVTSADVVGAHAAPTGDQWFLNVDLSDEAAKRLQDFSKQNVGRSIALLVDGKVYGTPRIASPITGKGSRIGEFTQADAERLANAVRDGCKR